MDYTPVLQTLLIFSAWFYGTASTDTSNCTFPEDIQDQEYMTRYSAPNDGPVRPQLRVYYKDKVTLKIPNKYGILESKMKCENGMILGDNISFFYTKSPLSQFKNKTTISINVCTQLVVTPYALLEKDEEGKYDNETMTAAFCQDILYGIREPIYWFIKLPVPNPEDVTLTRWPIADGEYQMKYREKGTQWQCQHDTSSVAAVRGNVISLTRCSSAGRYDWEFPQTFICLGHVEERILGNSEDAGDVLLVADYESDGHGGKPRFYCIRISDRLTIIEFSIDISDPYSARCGSEQDANTASPGQLRHVVLAKSVIDTTIVEQDTSQAPTTTTMSPPTTTKTTTTTTTPSTTSPSTTTPPTTTSLLTTTHISTKTTMSPSTTTQTRTTSPSTTTQKTTSPQTTTPPTTTSPSTTSQTTTATITSPSTTTQTTTTSPSTTTQTTTSSSITTPKTTTSSSVTTQTTTSTLTTRETSPIITVYNEDMSINSGDPCGSQPCLNGATCTMKSEDGGYHCICATGYDGSRCSEEEEEEAEDNVLMIAIVTVGVCCLILILLCCLCWCCCCHARGGAAGRQVTSDTSSDLALIGSKAWFPIYKVTQHTTRANTKSEENSVYWEWPLSHIPRDISEVTEK